MKAIVTRYLGPTNHRGARVTAVAGSGTDALRVTLSWDNALNPEANHAAAAHALANKYAWLDRGNGRYYRLVSGENPDRRGNTYVLVPPTEVRDMTDSELQGMFEACESEMVRRADAIGGTDAPG